MAVFQVNFTDLVTENVPLPKDFYQVVIKEAKVKQPKDETDAQGNQKYPYLNLQLEITKGAFAGRIVFAMLTLNPSLDRTGRSANRGLFNLLNVLNLASTPAEISIDEEDLFGKELDVQIFIGKGKDSEGNEIEQNRVDEFFVYGTKDTSGIASQSGAVSAEDVANLFAS